MRRYPLCHSTHKVRYPDEMTAKLFMALIYHKDSSTRVKTERRAYRCPKCAGFHLTSTKR